LALEGGVMSILKKLIKIFLIVIISYYAFRFLVIYGDVIVSIGAKNNLRGKIVYASQGHDIKIIELPSGRTRSIYSVPENSERYLATVLTPFFSPDGKKIVFSKRDDPRIDLRYRLWIMNSDGTDLREILEMDYRYLISPSWSPDGKKIAFVARNSEQLGTGGLYVIDAENPSSVNLISNILPSLVSQPAWSPDSREIAFGSEELFSRALGVNLREEVDRGGIYVANIFDKRSRKAIEIATEPSWSPDGSKLAYEGDKGYYLADLLNGYPYNNRRIIPYRRPFLGLGNSYPIRWSPDGKYLVFCKEIWPGRAGIYVIALDNPKKLIRIATDYSSIVGMSWVE